MFGFVSRKKYKALEAELADNVASLKQSVKNFDDMVRVKDHCIAELTVALREADARNDAQAEEWNRAETRLARIVAMETPNCAYIGRKMAAVARGDGE